MSDFLGRFDGLANNSVFCMWTGANAMSPQRIVALWSVFNAVRCPVVYLNSETMWDWQLPGAPFHPAFPYLSATHKADFLRCYLMHHYGGGYTDLKRTSKNWAPLFAQLRQSGADALGYTELGPHTVAQLPGALGEELRNNHASLIGLCAFVFRKQTALTAEWYGRTWDLLDRKHDELRANPARHPQDQHGVRLPDHSVSAYPLRWTELLGDIFHPVIYRYRDAVLHADIAPEFHSYR